MQHYDARLSAAWHNDVVRGTQRARRLGHRPLHAAASAPGIAVDAPSAAAASIAALTERRHVSVLFADLVGFTTLAEARDSEEVRELHIYTDYLQYHPEGEITAKIRIPSRCVERYEKYDPAAFPPPDYEPSPSRVRATRHRISAACQNFFTPNRVSARANVACKRSRYRMGLHPRHRTRT